jgi:dipeptidyl aminopeptidase/acylaminoacyl peptidase
MTKRLARLAPVFVLALCQLTLYGQSPARQNPPASSWADEVLKKESYTTPPAELTDAVLAPRYLNVSLSNVSPDKKWFLDEIGDGPVAMKTFSKPFHELGGVFIDFKANRARALTIRNNVGIQLISAADGSKKPIQVPPGARVSNAMWSPDSSAIAFFVHSDDATYVYIADVATGKSRQLTKTPVLATLVSGLEFTDGGKQIATILVPDARAPMPPAPTAPTGPTVKIADSDKNRLRTFPSLMSTPHEKDLL